MCIENISASMMRGSRFSLIFGCSFDAVFLLDVLSDSKFDAILLQKQMRRQFLLEKAFIFGFFS